MVPKLKFEFWEKCSYLSDCVTNLESTMFPVLSSKVMIKLYQDMESLNHNRPNIPSELSGPEVARNCGGDV